MAIDIDRVLDADIPERTAAWDVDDVILYHLGVGAGVPPTERGELEYVLEDRLKVLPSFAVLPALPMLTSSLADLPCFDINPALLLHGEQDLELFEPLPPRGTVTTSARIVDVFDKGKGALLVFETVSGNGTPLFVNRFSAFVRGEGGFGGPPGPPPANEPPARSPDIEVERPTLRQQALLYRLSGDRNPLHADPESAKLGGFDEPILHGLCSYGIVCKAVVDEALDGDVGLVARYQARFAGVVFPGETIVVRMWHELDGRVIVAAHTKERGTPVVTNAAVTVRTE